MTQTVQLLGISNAIVDILAHVNDDFLEQIGAVPGSMTLVDMERAREMVAAGAAVLDVGGESTRPGARPVFPAGEMDRVLPLVERLSRELDVVVSVDTSSPALMTRAAGLGAGLINDVRALGREGALEAAAATGLPVCLMHMQGDPATMQQAPAYRDVVADVGAFLEGRVTACVSRGIGRRYA